MFSTPPPTSVVVTVQAGNTLSAIAQAHGVTWEAVWQDNRDTITDPNVIYVGESVRVPTASPSSLPVKPTSSVPVTPTPPPGPSGNSQPTSGQAVGSDARGWVPVPGMPDSFSRCVEMRESSDNPRSVNSIPGYIGNGGGLFGDLKSTWADYGGYAQPFDAPVSVQVAFNAHLFQQYGTSPWSPSDGCQLDGSVRS